MFALPLARVAVTRFQKSRSAKKAKENNDRLPDHAQQSFSPPPRQKHFQPLAIIPSVITSIVLILSLLCIFAGHTATFMQDYAVFTLNTSRIGENVIHKLDDKIRSFNLSDIGLKKRGELIVLSATPTMVPTTMITMAPIVERGDIGSLFSKATHGVASDAKSLKSKGKSEFSEVTSKIHSKVTSVEGAVASEAASIVHEIEDGLIKLINNAYTGFIEDLNIQDFYKVHVMASCTGTFAFQNGTNVTVGDSGIVAPSGPDSVHSVVDSCEQHSAVDPMSLIRIIYWTSTVFTIASFLSGAWAVACGCSRKVLLANLLLTTIASINISLASLLVHGIALAATKVINFLGSDMGITAMMGNKFLAMTWAATGLLTLNSVVWIVIYFVQKRCENATTPYDSGRPSEKKEQYPMANISPPMPVHDRPLDGRHF